MPLHVSISVAGFSSTQVVALRGLIEDRKELHARIAIAGEKFVQKRGKITAASEHRTANSLGARPTGHLTKAYEAIQHVSDAQSATLLIPRASRLRAAFGSYTLTPGAGRKYLTIPMNADAYGHRAREFDLFVIRSKKRNLILCRRDASGAPEPMYALVKSADIPEDSTLIPFDDLNADARDQAEDYYDSKVRQLVTASIPTP